MEYEVKFRIKDKKDILRKLKELKAEDLGEENQVDVFFDLNHKGVRVRKIGKEGLITIKKLVGTGGRAKVRKEIETKVSNVDSLIKILQMIGFIEIKRREKIRHTFRFDKMYVLLDRIPFMGYFIELEADSEAALKRITKKLGFDYKQAIADSYDNLFFNYYIKNARKYQGSSIKILPIFENERAFFKLKMQGITS